MQYSMFLYHLPIIVILKHSLAYQSTSSLQLSSLSSFTVSLKSHLDSTPHFPLKKETVAGHIATACLDFLLGDFSEVLNP